MTAAPGACAKVRGGREGTSLWERQGTLIQVKGKAAAPEGRTCGKATQRASPQEPDSGRTGEQNVRPDLKGPNLDRDQKLWGWAPQCQDRRQHPDRYSQAAGGETEAWKDRGCGVT